jgi:hypothetical protein
MNIAGVVFADFVDAPAGGPSRLTADLAGQPVLVRTLRRLLAVDGLHRRIVFVRPRDREAADAVLRDAELAELVELLPLDTSSHSRRLLLATARKWNLESWRGGLMGATWFDEYIDPPAVALALNHLACEAVLCVDGHQALLDPAIATAMLTHHARCREVAEMTFTQAPPGLAGLILQPAAVQQLVELNIPLGLLLSYRPELAQSDPLIHEACYHVSPGVAQTAARFVADTGRARELLALAVMECGEHVDAAALCAWTRQPGHDRAGALPVEVELELTTADPLPNTALRPRGARVPRREVSDLDAVRRLATELASYDDRLVVLGGHGDPLQHPAFAEVCRILRAAGIYGVGVVTPLVDLTDTTLSALFDERIDVVEVLLDANTQQTYAQVHGLDCYARVRENVLRIEATRRQRGQPQPIVACSLTRCAATSSELETFYDDWLSETGTAVLRGYNDYCGVLTADALLATTSRVREPCRRLHTRLALWADGHAPTCHQDFGGAGVLGDWTREHLRGIWAGGTLSDLRRAHRDERLEALPLCRPCSEWGRP